LFLDEEWKGAAGAAVGAAAFALLPATRPALAATF
jgi:hypothetical protein